MKDVTPADALEIYLENKARECAESTVRSHSDRLSHFVEWFNEETEYEHLHELDGIDLKQWRTWRFDPHEHSDAYIKAVQDSLRVFLRFARDIEAVDAQLAEKVRSPEGGQQRSAEIDADRGTNILEYLDRFQYATMDHALAHLLWYGMLRVGGVHSIDLDDIDWEELRIRLRHRPAKGTTLKNGYDSEREIAIRPTTAGILQDYVEHHRHDVTDEYDRRPLFTTEHGRPHRNTLRNRIYGVTRPCEVGRECPHGEDPEECQAAQRRNWAPKCPSSESTHAIRRGSISWHLRRETGKQVVSDRADVEPDTLDEHYNTLSESEKAEVRRSELPDELD